MELGKSRKDISLKTRGMAAIAKDTLHVQRVLEIAIHTHICFFAALNLDDLFMPTYIIMFFQHLPDEVCPFVPTPGGNRTASSR